MSITCLSAVFMCLGLSGVLPALHYLVAEGIFDILIPFSWLVTMALAYLTGGVIYAMRIPERLWPGKFDIYVSIILQSITISLD